MPKQLGPLVCVKHVEAREPFKALITFADGTKREIDLAMYLHGPIFEPIRNNPNVFRAMKVVGGTIAWDNGADIDPDVLYYHLKPAWMEESEMSEQVSD